MFRIKEIIFAWIIWLILWWIWVYYWYNSWENLYNKEVIKSNIQSDVSSGNIEKYSDTLSKLEKQFKTISNWKTYEQLIKSNDYQNWVKNIATLIDNLKFKWKQNIVNYIYYNFISDVVLKYLNNYSDFDKDLVIQSIRRIDFNTMTNKNYYTQLMKDYVDEKYYKPILANLDQIDKKKLDTNIQYFAKIMLNVQNWIFYRIFKNRYDWNKTGIWFKPEFLENQFVDFLCQRFEQILWKLWYNKEWFRKKVFQYYNIDSLEWLRNLIEKDFEDLNKTYNLKKLWIPIDRFFRMDERRFLFNQDWLDKSVYKKLWNRKEWFKDKVKQLRLKMYLLSYFWKDINLFNSRVRANYINSKWGFWIQNIFRVWRYVDEVMKLNLKPKKG